LRRIRNEIGEQSGRGKKGGRECFFREEGNGGGPAKNFPVLKEKERKLVDFDRKQKGVKTDRRKSLSPSPQEEKEENG